MRYLCVFGSIVLLAAAASAQDYRVGEYYAPYGICTGVDTTSVETVYEAPPSVSYPDRTVSYPDYYDRTVYYPRPVRYAEPIYRSRYYDPWRYRRGNWCSPRWNRDYCGYRGRHSYHGHHGRHR